MILRRKYARQRKKRYLRHLIPSVLPTVGVSSTPVRPTSSYCNSCRALTTPAKALQLSVEVVPSALSRERTRLEAKHLWLSNNITCKPLPQYHRQGTVSYTHLTLPTILLV